MNIHESDEMNRLLESVILLRTELNKLEKVVRSIMEINNNLVNECFQKETL